MLGRRCGAHRAHAGREHDALDAGRCRRVQQVLGAHHVDLLQAQVVRGAVPDHAGQVEHVADAFQRRRQRLGVGDVAEHRHGAGAGQPLLGVPRPHHRAHVAALGAQLPHHLHADVAGGTGDEGQHPGKPTGGIGFPDG